MLRGGLCLAAQPPAAASVRVGSPGPARSASRSPGPPRMSCRSTALGATAVPAAGVQKRTSLSPVPLRLHTPPRSPVAAARTNEPFKLAANYLTTPRRPSQEDTRRAAVAPSFCEATPAVYLAPQMAPQVAWGSAPGAAVALGGSVIGRRQVVQSFGTVSGNL